MTAQGCTTDITPAMTETTCPSATGQGSKLRERCRRAVAPRAALAERLALFKQPRFQL